MLLRSKLVRFVWETSVPKKFLSSISNAIYREIISRELTRYIRPDNSIDMVKLLLDFQVFFRQNADAWIERFNYKESGPQLLLQAFLQRVVNGGGYMDTCGDVKEGHFILFNRDKGVTWGGEALAPL